MKRLVSLALNQPIFMMLLTVLFIGAGVQAFRSLPVEAFPDVTDVQVTVITLDRGHAPEEVEKQVTIPMEIGLSGLPHSVRMFSHTQFGLSYIILTFDDQVNDYFARQQVLERIQTVNLRQYAVHQVSASRPVVWDRVKPVEHPRAPCSKNQRRHPCPLFPASLRLPFKDKLNCLRSIRT